MNRFRKDISKSRKRYFSTARATVSVSQVIGNMSFAKNPSFEIVAQKVTDIFKVCSYT